jgi:hypothetical protein
MDNLSTASFATETANGANQHTRLGQAVQPNFAEATAAITGVDARR